MKLVPISKVLFTIVMVIVTMSNFSNVNAQPTGQLTVVKEIDSSQLREGVDGPAPSPSQFNIQVTFSQGGNENDPGSSDGQDYFRAGGTTYSVTEDPNQISGITARVEFDGSCGQNGQDDTIEVGTPKTCTVINHILSVGPGAVTGEGTSSQIASTSQDTEEFSFQSGLAIRPARGIAPFDKCVAPVLQNSSEARPGGEAASRIVHAPSSASYTIDGTTSVRNLFDSLQENNELTIKIFQDRLEDDGVILGVASPIFTGQLFVGEDPELFPDDAIRYDIDDISTECEFVTLTNPISQNPQVAFHPLGNTSEIKTSGLNFDGDPTTNLIPNELLAYCSQKVKVSNDCIKDLTKVGFSSSVLNPPFRSCSDTLENSQSQNRVPENGQAWAQYIIKGTVGMIPTQSFVDLVSGDRTGQLMIKLISDLVLLNSDEIKIADANNPFLTVYFIVNPGEPTATRVPFTIQQVSTNCNAADFIEDPQIN